MIEEVGHAYPMKEMTHNEQNLKQHFLITTKDPLGQAGEVGGSHVFTQRRTPNLKEQLMINGSDFFWQLLRDTLGQSK